MSRTKASPTPTRKNNSITVVLPNAQLRKLCDHAEAMGLPQGPTSRFWKEVDEDGIHVISFNFAGTGLVESSNGKKWVRAMAMCKMRGRIEPQGLLCDFDYDQFTRLVKNTERYIPIGTLPKTERRGFLCHNHIQHESDTPCGENGFRAWRTDQLPPDFVRCNCGWVRLTH